MLSYWFYPNPGSADYDSPKVLIIFGVCILLFVGSFLISRWRQRPSNPVTKKLSRSWVRAMRLFAFIGTFLAICRVEEIQFFAMRFLWLLWGLALLGFFALQIWLWRKKHYTVVEKQKVDDPRDKYLP